MSADEQATQPIPVMTLDEVAAEWAAAQARRDELQEAA